LLCSVGRYSPWKHPFRVRRRRDAARNTQVSPWMTVVESTLSCTRFSFLQWQQRKHKSTIFNLQLPTVANSLLQTTRRCAPQTINMKGVKYGFIAWCICYVTSRATLPAKTEVPFLKPRRQKRYIIVQTWSVWRWNKENGKLRGENWCH
jgi:hypothetical protein